LKKLVHGDEHGYGATREGKFPERDGVATAHKIRLTTVAEDAEWFSIIGAATAGSLWGPHEPAEPV